MNRKTRYTRLLLLPIASLWLVTCTSPAAPSSPTPAQLPTSTPPPIPTAVPTASPAPPSLPTSTRPPTRAAVPTPSPTPDPAVHVRWRFPTEGAIWGTPAFYHDTIYVGSDDGHLYAVAAATGELRWAFATGGIVRSRPDAGESAGRSLIYFTSDDGYLYAVDAGSGDEAWRADIGNVTDRAARRKTLGSSPNPTTYDYLQSSPVLAGGRIYVGSADGRVYALRADTGEQVWTFQTGEKVRATPTVSDGVIYVGSWDKDMLALDAATGDLVWRTPLEGQVQTCASVADGLVYSASRKASVVALDTATGDLVWEYSYGKNMWVESSPTLVDAVLYIGSSGTRMLFGLDRATGEMRLGHNMNAFCWTKPLIIDQTLVIGCTNDGNFAQGLNVFEIGPHPRDKRSLALTHNWRLPMGESLDISGVWTGVASSAIYAEGVIYFGGLDGVLYAAGL